MPHEGVFYGGKEGDEEYHYELDKWKETEGKWQEEIDDSDLTRVEDLVVKIENQETHAVAYNTITGPFEDWEIVEEILGYTWGPEGDSEQFSGA